MWFPKFNDVIFLGWIPKTSDTSQWFEVDLEEVYIFSGVQTQGCGDVAFWVETYKVAYSNDSSSWTYVDDGAGSDRVGCLRWVGCSLLGIPIK